MADPTKAEIDYDKLGAAVAKALPGLAESLKSVADNQKIIADTMAAQTAAAKEAGKDAGKDAATAKPLSAEDVSKIVGDALKSERSNTDAAGRRAGFIADKLKDLPAVYQNQLGGDPTKWAGEEATIREQYKADFKTSGGKTPDVSGAAGGAAGGQPPAAAAIDLSKMSAMDKIKLGLKSDPIPASGQVTAGASNTASTGADAAK